jgi:hypothetical protein
MRQGFTNSDLMRQEVSRRKKRIVKRATRNFDTPSGKFVNEHAWVLERLVVRKIIEKISEKGVSPLANEVRPVRYFSRHAVVGAYVCRI